MDFVKKGMETKTKSLADIVKEQLPKDSVNKDDIRASGKQLWKNTNCTT